MASPVQQVWPEGRPARPNTKDWFCHGSLGWTLQQALDEMDEAQDEQPMDDDKEEAADTDGDKEEEDAITGEGAAPQDDDNNASDDDDKKPAPVVTATKIKATPEMRQAILEALAAGPARMKQAPHGIIKGRIKYYQRQGSRWRMEVDDIRIRRRLPLAKIRRKAERPSLWDLSRESRQGKEDLIRNDKDAEQTKWSFELLAYNDIE